MALPPKPGIQSCKMSKVPEGTKRDRFSRPACSCLAQESSYRQRAFVSRTEGHLTLRLQAVFRSDPIQRCIQSQIGWWLRIHLPAVCPPRGIRILTGVEISHPETRYFSNLEIACHSQLNTGRDIDIGSCVSTGTGSGILSRNHRV